MNNQSATSNILSQTVDSLFENSFALKLEKNIETKNKQLTSFSESLANKDLENLLVADLLPTLNKNVTICAVGLFTFGFDVAKKLNNKLSLSYLKDLHFPDLVKTITNTTDKTTVSSRTTETAIPIGFLRLYE